MDEEVPRDADDAQKYQRQEELDVDTHAVLTVQLAENNTNKWSKNFNERPHRRPHIALSLNGISARTKYVFFGPSEYSLQRACQLVRPF